MPRFTCPCCGYVVFHQPPGNYEVCPICYWEDDGVQVTDPWFDGGANTPNLVDAQRDFLRFGAMEERFVEHVRKPTRFDRKDARWRPVEESDRQFVTTPREIEQMAKEGQSPVSYHYWIRRNDA